LEAITNNIQKIIKAKNDESCDETTINKKINEFQQLLGLLDAAFAYLNIYYLDDIEKQPAKEAVNALS